MTLPFLLSLVICPAGTLSREGACTLCPQGSYQDEEGRDFCYGCPRGSSHTGASSVSQCEFISMASGLKVVEIYNTAFPGEQVLPVYMSSSLGVFTCFRCDRLSEARSALFRKRGLPPSTT